MSRAQQLRLFVHQRLHAAVEEILAALEETIAKYEEEAALSQEVISRQHALLCALHGPLMERPSADAFTQQLLATNTDVPSENQNQNQNQQDPPAKQEAEGEQLQDLDEAEIIQFTYNPRCAARPGEHVDRLSSAEPGSAGPDRNAPVQVVSSETEDSDDYGKDSTDARPAPRQPKAKRGRRAAGVFTCRACSRTFKARRFLFRHVKAHLQEAEPVCGFCGQRFEAAESLKLHFQTHHMFQQNQSKASRERPFHQHLQANAKARVHRSDGPLTCDGCGKTFRQVRKKKRHRCHLRRSGESVERSTARTRT